MAFNAYLIFHKEAAKGKGQGIWGESTSEPVKGWADQGFIEISDYGFGVTMPVTTSRSDGGGATVGRANFDVFTCTKGIDTSTAYLVKFCCTGKNIPAIVLHLFRQGEETDSGVVQYAMVVFQNCVITKVGISGSGEELPKETMEFNYGLCEYTYQFTDHKTGKADTGCRPKFGWSTVSNQAKASGQTFGDKSVADAAEK